MTMNRLLICLGAVAVIAGCESGDINLTPTNVDNSTDNSTTTTGGGAINPCASYSVSGTTRQGSFDGRNCTYNAAFVSETNPLTVDLLIPFFSGVHIFQNSLFVGQDVSSGVAPASGTGAKLTIEAGATIAFLDSGDYLLINRGSQIIANGSATAPITFTGFTDAVTHTAGPYDVQLWGGMVINGNALTNNCTDAQRAGNACHVQSEGRPSYYGGNDPTDNSGVLRYIILKHPGFEVAPGDELNGITFNAVGSGTTVENLEIYSSYDDGVEFFGGSVNITNYVALYVRDDSIDFSDGYNGTINNALVIHSPTDGNRCVEGDNVASTRVAGGASHEPISRPVIRHLTCILSNNDVGTHGDSEGLLVRYGARLEISDSIIDGGLATLKFGRTSNECWELERDLNNDTANAAQAGVSTMNRVVIACQEPYSDNLVNGDTGSQWILGAGTTATYPFNTFNVIITAPDNANVRVLEPATVYSFDGDAVAATVTIRDATGTNVVIGSPAAPVTAGYIGALKRSANWTANWTYGLNAGNRGVTPWWE